MTLLLLSMFSPICSSLRSIQQAGELKKVQKKLRVPRSSLGCLSEAATVFDSDLMIEIIGELASQLKPIAHNCRLSDIKATLTIVDGTLLKSLPKTVDALWKDENNKAYKAHMQYELLKGVPVASKLTNGNANEKQVLTENLEAGRFYVLDRGYAKYELLQQIIDIKSHFACRIYDCARFEIIEDRQIDSDALEAGVLRDMVVKLGDKSHCEFFKQPVRIIEIKTTERTQYTAHTLPYQGKKVPDTMLICTDRLDLPADVIALIYKHRWEIEIFFRFFKHVLGCRHLISYSDNGVELQLYAAIITCLLIAHIEKLKKQSTN